MRDMLAATSAFVNCVGGTNGDLPTELTLSDIQTVYAQLKGNSAYSFLTGIEGENRFGTGPVRDAYFALGHTDIIPTLESVQNFLQKWNYPAIANSLESEHGAVINTRWLLSPIASVTPNASALGANVYNNFICGRESYAAIEQTNYSSRFIYRDPIHSDPLAQNATVGWKAAMAPRLLNSAWVFNLRSTLAA